jgi:predicted glutamine amidotransferase
MDINLAKQTIESAIKSRTDELATLILAQSILTDTYKAEFTAKDTATAEADAKSAELNAEKVKTATLTSEKEALAVAYNNALTEKDTLITESVAKDKTIEDLQSQVAEATATITTLQTVPADPIQPVAEPVTPTVPVEP